MGNTMKPIKSIEKLTEIQEGLYMDGSERGKRMFLLFMTGIYTGLRISDIVRLKLENVCGAEIETVEQKTGKTSIIPVAVQLRAVINDRCSEMEPGDYLFPSKKKNPDGSQRHISTRQAYGDMREIARRFGLGNQFGCHSMRKTFGYHHYQQNHDIEILRAWFNHSNELITRRYICVESEEMRRSLHGFNLGFSVQGGKSSAKLAMKASAKPLEIERMERCGNPDRWKSKK